MYFDFSIGINKVTKVSEKRAFGVAFFLEAPSKNHILELIKKGIIKEVAGTCFTHTPVSEIKKGVRYKFLAGDPIEFEGELVGVVVSPHDHHSNFAKISITENVFFYSYEDSNKGCYAFLQLLD